MAEKRVIVKRVKNAVLFSDGTIRVDNVRASHPHLDKPYAGDNDDGGKNVPKYAIVGMMDKKTHVEAKDLLVEAMKKVMVGKDFKVASDKRFLRNGDDSDKEEYAGHWTFSAREVKAPKLRDENKENVDRADAADKFYGGCYVNVLIRPWVQNNKYGKRINANLLAVQFVKDGEAFGEGRLTDDDVDDSFDDAAGEFGGDSGDDDDDDL